MDRELDLRGRIIPTEEDLRWELKAILALEASPDADWEEVGKRCLSLVFLLINSDLPAPPEVVRHFIDDCDIRQRDPEYAKGQRDALRKCLNGAW